MVNCAVTQGGEPLDIAGKVQPAIAYGVGWVTIGIPDNVTRGFTAVGVAFPAWTQLTIAVDCSIGPGMITSRSFYVQRPFVDIGNARDVDVGGGDVDLGRNDRHTCLGNGQG